jgi:putative peptidoglycan lipid II flippase
LLGVSVAQVSLLINTQIASHLTVGSVSWLTYADRLMEFPTALLGVALGVVLLPRLSAAQAGGDDQSYSAMLDWGLRMVVLLALPCAVALVLFADPLVAVLYHYGRFTPHDAAQTVMALQGYGVGLLGLIAIKVLAPGFYARQDVRTPVRIAVVVLLITQGLNAAFVPWLGHAGLALSIGLAAMINAVWLLVGLRKKGAYSPLPGWPLFLLRVLVACGVLAVGLWAANLRVDWLALQAMPWVRAMWLAGAVVAAALVYFATLRVLGLRWWAFMRRAP